MWKFTVLLLCLNGYCLAGPVGQKRNMPIVQQRNDEVSMTETESADPNEMMIMSSLSLPSNATSIRADITDVFSCENKTYGYYADVDNDCQIFHVCLPVIYADGKENTFRWSFICPEETIFSQDSFTCMRPDDMTISCDESYQYYELNRKFGMVDSNGDKETSNEAATATTAESNENIAEAESEAEAKPVKPNVQEEEEPIIGQSKPINVVKPSRRKPVHAQRKPVNSYPLRKMPQTQEAVVNTNQISQDVNKIIKPIAEEEIKPLVHKYSRRPVIAPIKEKTPEAHVEQISPETPESSKPEEAEEEEVKPLVNKFSRRPITVVTNTLKDKIQNSKTENVMATRTELFNQIRKRPNLFNKKPADQAEDDKAEEPAKVESPQEEHNFSPLAIDMSNSNTETKLADTKIEASESQHVFVKPQEANDIPQNIDFPHNKPEEPAQVLEAFEEIPAVISEVMQIPNAEEEETHNEHTLTISNEKSDKVEEPQIIEVAQSTEEEETKEDAPLTPEEDESQTAVKTSNAEETQNVEENQTAQVSETAQEIHDVPDVPQSLRTSAEEIQNFDETKTMEEPQPIQEVEETQNVQGHEAAEETPNMEEQVVKEESETPTEMETAEETRIAEESQKMEKTQIKEGTKPNEEPQIAEEAPAAEEISPAEEIPTADKTIKDEETQALEAEMPETIQSLRTSAEEVQNVETNVDAEEQPLSETQTNEETALPEENEATAQSVEQTHQEEEEDVKSHGIEEQASNAEVTPNVSEMLNKADSQETDQTQAVENSLNTIQETLVVEEPQPIVHQEESQIDQEMETIEDTKPFEENNESESVESASVNSESEDEPATAQQLSEESVNTAAVQTIEQMESEKPVEAPESMQATEEMSQPNAMVQQLYEDMDMNKHSIKGLNPIDPVMAHEAEQLIADFINTLRNNDFTNETPGMQKEHPAEEPAVEQESMEGMAEVQSAEKAETGKIEDVEKTNDSPVEISETQADAVEENPQDNQEGQKIENSHQESMSEDEEQQEMNSLKSIEDPSMENETDENKHSQETNVEAMNLPQEMYQIPVQVITSPIEEITMNEDEQSHESEMKSSEMPANSEQKTQDEKSPAAVMAGNKPLSIDDIVELVKERLDQMPKNEMETPMQLEQVLGVAQDDKTPEEEEQQQSSASIEDEPKPNSQSVEETVMPIYQRTVQPAHYDETLKQDSNEALQTQTAEDVSEIKEKTNRSYKTKLDSRKRRFLFKADSS